MSTILLVEDNPSNASLLEDIFAYDDIPAQLTQVASGEEAMSVAVLLHPALILMDLRLPGIDGLETTAILKSNPLTKDIPVWALTAYAMQGDEERARAVGCDEYFAKPVSMRLLGDRIKDFLIEINNKEGHEREDHERESHEYASTKSTNR
jgi:two-component system, cell cycle response regulator DivK